MRKYKSPRAHNLSGKSFGFPGIDRLSALSVKTAQAIDWHTHEETEILCCLKGSLTYEFRSRPTVTLPSGCFMVVPSELEHRLVGGIDGPSRRFSLFIRRPRTHSRRPIPVSDLEMRELLSRLLLKRLRPRTLGTTALPSATRLADLIEREHPLSILERLAVRTDTLAVLLSIVSDQRTATAKPELRLMKEATEWMKRHAAEKISMDQLVTYMGYGRSRFFTLFRDLTGLTPVEWITRHRIELAADLLRTTSDSVTSIARRCGFADAAFFARIFHRRMGSSPSEFRSRPA